MGLFMNWPNFNIAVPQGIRGPKGRERERDVETHIYGLGLSLPPDMGHSSRCPKTPTIITSKTTDDRSPSQIMKKLEIFQLSKHDSETPNDVGKMAPTDIGLPQIFKL